MKRYLTILLSLVITYSSHAQSPKQEFRGLWITTINNIDWPSSWDLTPEQQRQEFISIIERAKENGINAVFIQVRGQSDAIYKSKYEPWSQWLNKVPGKAPDPYYDPLEFMVEECHQRCMEFHAWFNLFRGVSHTKFSLLTDDHISKTKPEWFYNFDNSKFMDPGIPEAKDYLIKVVLDVVDRYDIDGVHLDDYFYPIESKRDSKLKIRDKSTYQKHKGDYKNIDDWRRYNINIIIKQLNDSIKSHKNWVKFGVSPFPVWKHKWNDARGSETSRTSTTYENYYADTRKWIKYKWVDYLAPQMYWGTKFDRINYNKICQWWDKNHFGRHIYFGHAFYKLTSTTNEGSSDPSWLNKYEINDQIRFARNLNHVKGGAMFSAKSFNDQSRIYEKWLRDSVYNYPSLIPSMSWIDSIPPLPPTNLQYFSSSDQSTDLKSQEAILKWTAPEKAEDGQGAYYYVVYRFETGKAPNFNDGQAVYALQKENYLELFTEDTQGHYFIVKSVDRCNNESRSFIGIYPEQ